MNVDIVIVAVFLAINLIAGIYSGKGVNTIKDYAIGDRNFSTATLSATLIATWIGGGFFAIGVSQTYQDGLYYIIASTGDIIALLIVAYIFSSRMKEFLGKISLAEVMGELYGKHVRIISALACIAISTGAIALQLKVISSLFNYFFGFSSVYAVLASSFVIIVYSTFGGIKSVTFTDTIQFLTFGTFVPIFALFIWKALGDHQTIINNISNSPLFDYRELTNYQNPKFLPYLTIFLYSAALTPLDPSLFQRALLARNTDQIRKSFVIAAFVGLFVLLASCSIGVIIYGHNPDLDPNNLMMYIIDNYSYPGLKGIVLVGILAITMSTADSWINVASVICAHDFCKPLKIEFGHSELFISRIFSIVVGSLAIVLALTAHNLLDLLLLIGNFFCPIVAPILFLGILGFRSTPKAALIAIFAGIITTIIWRVYWQESTNIDSVMPGTLANLIVFVSTHFVLKDSKVISKADDYNNFSSRQLERLDSDRNKEPLTNLRLWIEQLKNFNFIEYFNDNSSKHTNTYIHFGIFTALSMLCSIILLDQIFYQHNITLINVIQITILGLSTSLITHKLWSEGFRKSYLASIWYITIFVSSAVTSSFFVLVNDFSPMSLMVFSINILVISYLLKWQETLIMLLGGTAISYIICYHYFDTSIIHINLYDSKFSVIYSLLMLTSSLIFFLKPKQEYQALTEEKNEHLSGRIGIQEKQLKEALALRSQFIRNVQHEYHAPMTGITSFAQTLDEAYDKLTEQQRKESIKIILNSSRRLDAFDSNISSLSVLSKAGYELDLEKINLSNLLYLRIVVCRKLYEENKDAREFDIDIEDNVIIDGDKKYLIQVLDNLIINAITYCKTGKITIYLEDFDGKAHLTMIDEGIGIPEGELENIFNEFTVSSRTRSPAGNRGVGLALCKRVVEVHKGSIEAESNGEKGAIFKVIFNKVLLL